MAINLTGWTLTNAGAHYMRTRNDQPDVCEGMRVTILQTREMDDRVYVHIHGAAQPVYDRGYDGRNPEGWLLSLSLLRVTNLPPLTADASADAVVRELVFLHDCGKTLTDVRQRRQIAILRAKVLAVV